MTPFNMNPKPKNFIHPNKITRIQQVNKTYLDDVFALFNKRLLDGKTLKETTAEVFKVMKAPRFYKYQAERIARTETTALTMTRTTKQQLMEYTTTI